MVCDQLFCVSYLDQFVQRLSAMSIISNGINQTAYDNYSDSDIPWKFCTSKTESL